MPTIDGLPAARTRVNAHLERAWEAAKAARRPDLQGRLRAEADRVTTVAPATLLVVGETKRGKSSLINALVRAPDLVPVDADVATAVAVQIRHGEKPAAHVFVEGGAEPEAIDPASVADWAATWGTRRESAPTLVTVEWPSEFLARGVVLVDTPGVGGLDPAHRQVALAQLALADALLFVLDASEQLSRPELSFLEEARSRVDTVLIAMTKIDRHPSWRLVHEKNLELLAGLGPELAAAHVVPVSSSDALLADRIAAEGDVDTAAAVRADSGYDELEREIVGRVVDRREWLRLANLLRVTDHALEEAAAWHAGILAGTDGDPRPVSELEGEIAALERARTDAGSWLRRLVDRFTEASTRLSSVVTETDQRLRSEVEGLIAEWRPTTAQTLPAALDAGLQSATLELSRLIPEAAAAAALDVAEHLGVTAEFLPPAVELASLESVAAARTRAEPGLDAEMALRTGLALTMGQGAGGAIAVVAGALGVTVLPGVAIGLGLAIGALNARVTRAGMQRAKGQAHARRIAGEAVALWSTRARTETSTQLGRLRQYAEHALGDAVETRSADLTRRLAELTRAVAEAKRAADVRATHERRIAELREERAAVAESLDAVRAVG